MKNRKKKKRLYPYVFLFIFGVLIFIYPFISQIYYDVESNALIENFEKETKKLETAEIKKKIDLAKSYNETLNPLKLADPYTDNEKEGIAEYARMLEIKELIGHIEVPKLKINIPIYAGTSNDILDKGAGHLEGSSLPVGGVSTHTVITAHRGLASAEMFRNLDKLKEGDVFFINNIEGKLAYRVDKIQIVKPTNFEPVLVKEGYDYATLLTCDPYVINTHRLLVRGYRIPYEDTLKYAEQSTNYNNYIYIVALIITLISFSVYKYYRRERVIEKK